MIPSDLSYDFPQAAFLGLAIFLILFLFWLLYLYREKASGRLGDPLVIKNTMIPRSSLTYWTKSFGLAIAWVLAVVALMQPKGDGRYPEEYLPKQYASRNPQQPETVRRKAHDVIFLIDASASMAVKDSRDGVSRLDYAREIAEELIGHLDGETASLYAFTSQPMLLSPSTLDYIYVRLMVHEMQINEGDVPGTDIKKALEDVRKHHFARPAPKLRTLILLTDGGDTEMEALQGGARQHRMASIVELVGNAATLNLRVYTIGMGTKAGGIVPGVDYHGSEVNAVLDDDILQQLARRGRGEYFYANGMSSIEIADATFRSMSQDNPYVEESTVLKPAAAINKSLAYDYFFQIPLGLAILLLMYALLYPDAQRKQDIRIKG